MNDHYIVRSTKGDIDVNEKLDRLEDAEFWFVNFCAAGAESASITCCSPIGNDEYQMHYIKEFKKGGKR